MFDYDTVLGAVERVRREGGAETIVPYSPEAELSLNELLVFIKPELTTKYPEDARTLKVIAERLADFNCRPRAASVIGPDSLRAAQLIERHYGLINTYSNGGYAALPPGGKSEADAVRAQQGIPDAPVLGAHQVLEEYPDITPDDLLRWHDEASDTFRLASGAYAFLHDLGGGTALVIDGFHPAQISHFYETRDPIAVFVVQSDVDWDALRTKMCGATNPAKAETGSIRRDLLERRAEFGLESFDAMRNGIHVSAGPLEAAVEISRYMSTDSDVPFTRTSFGSILADEFGADRAEALAGNPPVELDGKQTLAFDATEHRDAADAIETLRRARW